MKEMEITEIEIHPIKPRQGLVGFASCVINDSLYLGNIAIHTSPSHASGYRLVYPNKLVAGSKEIPCVYPINHQTADTISAAIINQFEKVIVKVTINHGKNS